MYLNHVKFAKFSMLLSACILSTPVLMLVLSDVSRCKIVHVELNLCEFDTKASQQA